MRHIYHAFAAGLLVASLEITAQQPLPNVKAVPMSESQLITTMDQACRQVDSEHAAIYLPSRQKMVPITKRATDMTDGYRVYLDSEVASTLLANMNDITLYHCHPSSLRRVPKNDLPKIELNLMLPSVEDMTQAIGQRALAIAYRPNSKTRFRIVTDDLADRIHVVEFGTVASYDDELRSVLPSATTDKALAQKMLQEWEFAVRLKAKQTSDKYNHLRNVFFNARSNAGYAQFPDFVKMLDAAKIGIYVKEVTHW